MISGNKLFKEQKVLFCFRICLFFFCKFCKNFFVFVVTLSNISIFALTENITNHIPSNVLMLSPLSTLLNTEVFSHLVAISARN